MSPSQPLVDPDTFKRQLGLEIERARRYRHSLGLAIVRLDQVDRFLEQDGKESQACLAQVTETIRNNTRSSDLAARREHNAVIVLFPETDLEAARKACEKLRGEVLKLKPPRADVQLTLSCGV
ncbi:MAG TPA: diguanylate cyclase, partial [Planctomycetota bacterium]|nr:diguanylate cyclase [Planctomycetota bacterium]